MVRIQETWHEATTREVGVTSQTSGSGAAGPEFSHPLDVARLRARGGEGFDISPNAAETAALVGLFGARGLSGLRFSGTLAAQGRSNWALQGLLEATIIQSCVVSGVPVTTHVSQPVRRLFVPAPASAGIDIDPEEDADVEVLGPVIDLGLIATEELALAVPEYPRAPGAELDPAWSGDGGQGDDEGQDKPFDALRALRDRLPE
jgi:uncharacterized metal-binding protein YceD (DUF177 family)